MNFFKCVKLSNKDKKILLKLFYILYLEIEYGINRILNFLLILLLFIFVQSFKFKICNEWKILKFIRIFLFNIKLIYMIIRREKKEIKNQFVNLFKVYIQFVL